MTRIELNGAPTKRFFVDMLPRDIELDDAILDLVDNSIDGAMRKAKNMGAFDNRYRGMRCELVVTPERFSINDNCGGIPESHFDAAFRLGRPTIGLDGDLPTVGMYGIGMKRAIFKMAKSATVESRASSFCRRVEYTAEWLTPADNDDDNWNLDVETLEKDPSLEDGVYILIDELKDDTKRRFSRSDLVEELRDKLGEVFGYIMEAGFTITLNGTPVKPKRVHVIHSESIKPYTYFGIVDGVEIEVTIGVFRSLATQGELDRATTAAGATSGRAGVTVVCNDRVVLVENTSTITGWGVAKIPKFHPQFRAITGLIEFRSDDAFRLPVSTTKRDLDTDTNTYNEARNRAMEGLRRFTQLTNVWKGRESELNPELKAENLTDARVAHNIVMSESARAVRGSKGAAKQFLPDLPRPSSLQDPLRKITFRRPLPEIRKLGESLLDDPNSTPSEVGEKAWEDALKRYTSQ